MLFVLLTSVFNTLGQYSLKSNSFILILFVPRCFAVSLQCFAVSLQCLCSVFNTLGQYLLKSNSFILPFCSLCSLCMMFYKLYCPYLHLELFLKMGQTRPLLHLLSSFQTHITNFTKNRQVKNVHPVYGAGIQTHNLWNVSLLP